MSDRAALERKVNAGKAIKHRVKNCKTLNRSFRHVIAGFIPKLTHNLVDIGDSFPLDKNRGLA